MLQFLRAHSTWTPRRRRGAAVQLVLGGLLLMGVPALLGDSAIASGFRMLAPVAWLLAVAGAVLLLWPADARGRSQAAAGRGGPKSGAVPLQPMPSRPGKSAKPKAAAKAAAKPAVAAKAAPVPREPGDSTQTQPRFRDTELQFDNPDSVR